MKGKRILFGIVALVAMLAFAFRFVVAPYDIYVGRITFDNYFSKTTFSAIMVFVLSALASDCLMKKAGKKLLRSGTFAVCLGLIGVMTAFFLNSFMRERILDNILNDFSSAFDPGRIRNSLIAVAGTVIGGLLAGFGLTRFDFENRGKKEKTAFESSAECAPVSKTAAWALAFFLGGLGAHRYYLGYKTHGAVQTLGCVSLIVVYLNSITRFFCQRYHAESVSVFMMVLSVFGILTSIWAFADFIRILTGGLQPAEGKVYSEKTLQQVKVREKASEIADAIEKIAILHEKGILTEEEFREKKAEILKKM